MVAASLLPVGIIMGWDHSLDVGAICWAALTFLALFVGAFGSFTLRFQLMETVNKPDPAGPATSSALEAGSHERGAKNLGRCP